MRISMLIILLFTALVLSLRLILTYHLNYFDLDGYFWIRSVEHIIDTGTPLLFDELSQGGRYVFGSWLFGYILAGAGYWIGSASAALLIPNLLMVTLIPLTYLITRQLSNGVAIPVICAILSGFIPIHWGYTLIHITPMTLVLPLVGLCILWYIKAHQQSSYQPLLFISGSLLIIAHPLSIIWVTGWIASSILQWTENIRIPKWERFGVIGLTIGWIAWHSFLYGSLLLRSGFDVWWDTLIMWQSFQDNIGFEWGLLLALIGILPIISTAFSAYIRLFEKPDRFILHIAGIIGISVVFTWSSLIPNWYGLLLLGFLFIPYVAVAGDWLFSYLEHIRFQRYAFTLAWAGIIVVIIASALIPSITYALYRSYDTPTPALEQASIFLRDHTPSDITIIAPFAVGQYLMHQTGRSTFIDSIIIGSPEAISRLTDLRLFYRSRTMVTALELLEPYSITNAYVIHDPLLDPDGLSFIPFLLNTQCFSHEFQYESLNIYQITCSLIHGDTVYSPD